MIDFRYINDSVNKHQVQHDAGIKLLNEMLFETYGRVISESDIKKQENGKPYIDGCHFSISHCEGLCCCMVSTEECGIDCERIREYRPNTISRVFTESESEWFSTLPCCDKGRYFFILWTLKEAYGKYTGKGIADMKNVSFAIDNSVLKSDKPQLDFYVYEQDGYILSVCTKKGAPIRCTFGKQIL